MATIGIEYQLATKNGPPAPNQPNDFAHKIWAIQSDSTVHKNVAYFYDIEDLRHGETEFMILIP
jgi:hypothetical protein